MRTSKQDLLAMSPHDQKAVWHLSHLLPSFLGDERDQWEAQWREQGFDSEMEYFAFAIVEKLRDWDAGKPDAW